MGAQWYRKPLQGAQRNVLGRCKTLPNFHRAGVYLEFNKRETKTRSGNDPRKVRAIAPKMFALPNNEKCPVKPYKVYAEKRPAEMKTDDASFYLAVNNVKSGSGKPWFKKSPVCVNKLKYLNENNGTESRTRAKLQKPQRQKNYDSNFNQQRRVAN